MLKKDFPILEFDSTTKAKIEPSDATKKIDVPEHCMITFFGDVIRKMLDEGRLKKVSEFITCTVRIPIYETEFNGKSIGIIQGYLGAAGSGAQLEELIAMGFKKFIVCGAAGVLQKDIQVGHLIVPYSAIRDEGLSYHYLEPSREVECNKQALDCIINFLKANNIPYKVFTIILIIFLLYAYVYFTIGFSNTNNCFVITRFKLCEVGNLYFGR